MSPAAATCSTGVGDRRVHPQHGRVVMTRNEPATPTASSPENALLNVFVGRWHTTEEVASSPGPVTKIDALDTYEWLPGGYALIHYAESTVGDDLIQAIEIIGYDPSRRAYLDRSLTTREVLDGRKFASMEPRGRGAVRM
jgi:Protein of unknown function (DUF1579)